MSFANLPGLAALYLGVGSANMGGNAPNPSVVTMDAANEAAIMLGFVVTADGASHTIDTTGSSSIQWRAGTSTFADGATTVKVGLAAVDTAVGPPGRASNTSNVINFDVSASFTGGGGGITSLAWQTHVPTSGTKTIANGDLVALAVQMTARGGADSVTLLTASPRGSSIHMPATTSYMGAVYNTSGVPNAIIVFNDGTLGWFYGCEIFSTTNLRTYNLNTGTADEYGQLYEFPFPVRISGVGGLVDADGNAEYILYTDPLGTPVAQKTVTIDLNTVSTNQGRPINLLFSSPYDMPANTPFVIAIRPTTTTSLTAYYKTLADAAHRAADMGGTDSYGVARLNNTGAFAQENSGLDQYYVGPMVSGFEVGGGGGGLAAPLFGGAIV